MPRTDWKQVLDRAAAMAGEYDTRVTLRQLFYRLVSDGTLRNAQSAYKSLSSKTAAARRAGAFPDLIDRTREIHRNTVFDSPRDALARLIKFYERDRTQGQPVSVYLGVEKAGIVEQLREWFGEYGIPVLALGGYASQSYVERVERDVERQGRPAVLLYAGDFDPSGEDIRRDFVERTDCWSTVVRVALSKEQVDQYDLPPQPGKQSDSRAAAFQKRHGQLVQVEVDALPPATLRELFSQAVGAYMDVSIFSEVSAAEDQDRITLQRALEAI